MFPILANALRETLFMVGAASFIVILCGIPLGILIAHLANAQTKPLITLHYLFRNTIELSKYLPYLLVMLLFIPLTNWLINNQIAYTAATVIPLATAGVLLLAQKVYIIMTDLNKQWQATSKALGATNRQTLSMILLPEATPSLIMASSHVCALLVGFSTIAGALGAGGLGQLAIEKSIQQPEPIYVVLSIAILVVMQRLIEYTGTLVVQQTQAR